jgi:hypothetical protein
MAPRPGLEPWTCGLTGQQRAGWGASRPKITNAFFGGEMRGRDPPNLYRTNGLGIQFVGAAPRSETTSCGETAEPVPNRVRWLPEPRRFVGFRPLGDIRQQGLVPLQTDCRRLEVLQPNLRWQHDGPSSLLSMFKLSLSLFGECSKSLAKVMFGEALEELLALHCKTGVELDLRLIDRGLDSASNRI